MSAKSRSQFPVNQQAILSNRRVEHWVDLKRLNVQDLLGIFKTIHALQAELVLQIEKEILKIRPSSVRKTALLFKETIFFF